MYQIPGLSLYFHHTQIKHATIIVDKSLDVHVVIGIPPLPGLVYAYKKYVVCRKRTPWINGRIGFGYCRKIKTYTPETVSGTASTTVIDPRYNVRVPSIRLDSIYYILDPRRSLSQIIKHPTTLIEEKVVEAVNKVLESGVNLHDLGLTGSIPLGIAHEGSDIDIIVYGNEQAATVYRWMEGMKRSVSPVTVSLFKKRYTQDPQIIKTLITTRTRIIIRNTTVSIIMAQESLWDKEKKRECGVDLEKMIIKRVDKKTVSVEIEPGQPSALTFPPCIKTRDGISLLSFDHILSTILYEGGNYEIKAIRARTVEGEELLLLGVREPTSLRRK